MNMDGKHLAVASGAALLLILLMTGGTVNGSEGTVTFLQDGEEVAMLSVDIADEEEERRRGLMNRTISADEGMLFVFESEDRHSFWMKDVPQPLDIIFISSDMEVVSIFTGLRPCRTERCPSYTPNAEAMFAVETLEGFADGNGLEIGDSVRIDGLE